MTDVGLNPRDRVLGQGQHTDGVLRSVLGYDDAAIAELRQQGAAT